MKTKICAIVVTLLMTCFGQTVAGEEDITCTDIHAALQKIPAEFDNCHLVLANRGDPTIVPAGTSPRRQVSFIDIWMIGDDVQALAVAGKPNEQLRWWEGFDGLKQPLTTYTLDSVEGTKYCARTSGGILYADYAVMPSKSRQQYPSLYSTSRTPKPVTNLFVPFLEMNRGWSKPFAGGWPMASLIVTQTEPSQWRLVGREILNGIQAIKVEISLGSTAQMPLKRYKGTLGLTALWICWFSADQGYVPLRIESSVKYSYAGKDYPYELPVGVEPMRVYQSTDIQQPTGTVWFPMAGSQRTYNNDPASMTPFDADYLVGEILAKGKYLDTAKYYLATERDWRILKLEKAAPGLVTWFEPPNGAAERTTETEAFRIVGKTEEESRKQLMVGGSDGFHPNFAGRHVSKQWLFIAINALIIAGLIVRYAWKRSKERESPASS